MNLHKSKDFLSESLAYYYAAQFHGIPNVVGRAEIYICKSRYREREREMTFVKHHYQSLFNQLSRVP